MVKKMIEALKKRYSNLGLSEEQLNLVAPMAILGLPETADEAAIDARASESYISDMLKNMQSQADKIRTLEKRAEWKRAQKIASIRGDALSRLRLMADQIYGCLLLEMPLPAPSAEQLEPYFKLIEKLHEEERREGRVDGSLCDYVIEQVENNFIRYLKSMKYIQKMDFLYFYIRGLFL